MPWEMRAEDVRDHARWMEEEGYAASTINNALGLIESFYRWCGEQRVDAACGKEFNPARGVRRIKIERYAGASLLSGGEAARLLEALRADRLRPGRSMALIWECS
jgi:site-specific recombinase XerD